MRPDCERIEPLLSAYADGELEQALVEEVRAHLLGCEGCRKLLDRFKAVDRLYAELACEEPTEGRWRQMMWNVLGRAEVLPESEGYLTAGPRRIPMSISSGRSVRWAGWAAGITALAGVVLVAVFMIFGGPARPTGLKPLAADNTCHVIEIGTSAEGYEANLELPADKGDLLAIDITRTKEDRSDSSSAPGGTG